MLCHVVILLGLCRVGFIDIYHDFRSRKQRLTAVGIRFADHVTPLYPQNLALTSPTGGGRSVGKFLSRTKATEIWFIAVSLLFLSWSHQRDFHIKLLRTYLFSSFEPHITLVLIFNTRVQSHLPILCRMSVYSKLYCIP